MSSCDVVLYLAVVELVSDNNRVSVICLTVTVSAFSLPGYMLYGVSSRCLLYFLNMQLKIEYRVVMMC